MSGMPQFTVPPVDPRTGQWDRTWYLFFQDLWGRSGGLQPVSVTEISVAMPDDAGLEELKFDVLRARDELAIAPPVVLSGAADDLTPPLPVFAVTEDPQARIEALEAQVAYLTNELNAIRQGTATL